MERNIYSNPVFIDDYQPSEKDKIASKYGLTVSVGPLTGMVYEQWQKGKDRDFYILYWTDDTYRILSEYGNDPSKTGHIAFHELYFKDFEEACKVCSKLEILK